MSNNPLIVIKVSRFLSLINSIYEMHAHDVDAMLENLATTASVSSMNLV